MSSIARSVVSPRRYAESILIRAYVAEPLEHVAGVELGLAIGHLAVVGLVGPDESQVDRIQIQELGSLGNALEQQPVPVLRAGKALALDGQGLGIPVRDVELGLLQGDHVNDFVVSTRAQLNGIRVARGLASATTLPVQAPTVGTNGRPTVRPLNHSWVLRISILVRPGGEYPNRVASDG